MSEQANASTKSVTEARAELLDLAVLEARFDAVLPTLATKADLADLESGLGTKIESVRSELYRAIHEQTWRLIGATALLVGGATFLARVIA